VTGRSETARLFVGLPLPASLCQALAATAPRAAEGIRLISESDMHLTLHFLGSREVAPVAAALGSVGAKPFQVRLDGPGHFSLKGKKTVLWYGIEPSAPLSALHEATAGALAAAGFEPERRPWRPHVTLARLETRAARSLVDAFEGTSPAEAGFECTQFALYESQTLPEGARYRILESYPLAARA
jgi:RNA 2',3'-cyclic 3'-phosphodiesterase